MQIISIIIIVITVNIAICMIRFEIDKWQYLNKLLIHKLILFLIPCFARISTYHDGFAIAMSFLNQKDDRFRYGPVDTEEVRNRSGLVNFVFLGYTQNQRLSSTLCQR